MVDALKAMEDENHHNIQEKERLLLEREVRLHQPEALALPGAGTSAGENAPSPNCWRNCALTRDG